MFTEARWRTIAKIVTYRLVSSLTTVIAAGLLIRAYKFRLLDMLDDVEGYWAVAFTIGLAEIVSKPFLHYFHERVWIKVRRGKKEKVNPFVMWFTGLSGSGKSTLADEVYDYLKKKGFHIERLDGDVVRSIFPQTGFSEEERNRHVKRVGFLASVLENNGIYVVASFISPYREARNFVRELCHNFIEVYVSASVDECEKRDVKGLYKLARKGEIKNFTGLDDPYEIPENPELVVDTANLTVDESFEIIKRYIKKYLK